MAGKAIFLDADGTLVSDQGVIPDSARDAVAGARANGHKVFLATGRSLSTIWPDMLSVGFDGIVAAAGGYAEVDGQVLVRRHIPVERVQHVMDYFHDHQIAYFLEANSGLYGGSGVRDQLWQLMVAAARNEDELAELEAGFGGFMEQIQDPGPSIRTDINKVSFLHSPVPFETIQAEFAPHFTAIPTTVSIWGQNSGELSLPGVHKAAAIAVVLDHLGIEQSDSIAFGDNLNDLEMLQYVGVGVAMGQAPDAVKAVSDEVTGSPDQDGIREGFVRLGLVGR